MMYMRCGLFCDITRHRLVVPYVCFGATYRVLSSQGSGSPVRISFCWTAWLLKTGRLSRNVGTELAVSALPQMPRERRSHFVCCWVSDLIYFGGKLGEGILPFDIDPVPYTCPSQHLQFVLCSPRQTNSPSISTVCILPTLVCTFFTPVLFSGGRGGGSSTFIKIKRKVEGLLVKWSTVSGFLRKYLWLKFCPWKCSTSLHQLAVCWRL